MSRLIIATNSATATKVSRNAITAHLDTKGWSVWHWFEDLWLVTGAPDDLDLRAFREELIKTVGSPANLIVIKPEGRINATGWVPQKSIPWIKEEFMTGEQVEEG